MPYGYGSANRRGPSGPPGGGATSRGSGRDFSPRPRAPTVSTGGPPSIISRPTPTPVTMGGPPGGGDPGMTYTAPPVTRGGGPPGGGGGGGPPGGGGITGTNRFKKFISRFDPRHTRFDPRYWSDETGGNLLQTVANMPKYWELPSGIRSLIEAGEDIPFAHGFKTKGAMEAAKKYGFETSRFKRIITSIDGSSERADVNKFIDTDFLSMDSLALRKHIAQITPDVNLTTTAKFPDGREEKVAVEITAQFFWPTT